MTTQLMIKSERDSNHSLLLSAGLAFAILGVSACVTTTPPAPTTKPATGGAQKVEEAPPAETSAKVEETPPTEAALAEIVGRLSEPSAPLTDADALKINAIKNGGTLEEAAQILAALKIATSPLVRPQSQFEESDLSGSEVDATAPATRDTSPTTAVESVDTLEKLVTQRNLDLAGALAKNSFLQSAGVHRQVLSAASRPGNSEAFTQSLRSATEKQVELWKGLAGDIGPATTETPVVESQPAAPQQDPNAPPPSLNDLRGGDDVIAEAEALANRGEFEQAVGLLSSVDSASPMYPMAQERLKTVSNRAVQNLRRQAAVAFQTAAPLTDPKSRAIYLEQAKALLETALAKFPAADQLPTVRENLAVISRDLARIAADRK